MSLWDGGFLVLMDLEGATRMPRNFYYRFDKLRRSLLESGASLTRIQQSCYLASDEAGAWGLASLGRDYGFDVQIFDAERVI